MQKRLLLITQWFDPEPTFKGILFAKELNKLGFDVEVVTGFPNYPGGKVYKGYKIKIFQKEIIDGIKVIRLPLFPSHNKSKLGRVFNYVSFFISTTFYVIFFAKRPDFVYAYHPPLTVGLSAVLLKLIKKTPVLYDIQDMWPDTLKATKMVNSKLILNIISNLCIFIYKNVDHIVVLSSGFKEKLEQRGVCNTKIDVIYNWANEDSLRLKESKPVNFFESHENSFNVVFAGNVGKAQALEVVTDAALLSMKKNENINFFIVGDGLSLDDLKKIKKEKLINNLYFLPPVPMNKIGAILNSADALLVHLKKDPLFKITIPSKVQAYMAVGKPIISGLDGNANELINDAKCGVIFESENSEQLFEATKKLKELNRSKLIEMGANASSFYDKNLSVKAGVKKFASILQKLNNPN